MYRRSLFGIAGLLIVAAVLLMPPVVEFRGENPTWVERHVLGSLAALLAVLGMGAALYGRRTAGRLSDDLRIGLRRRPRLLLAIAGFSATLLSLLAVEATFRIIDRGPAEQVALEGTYVRDFYDDDGLLGYRGTCDTRTTLVKRIGDTTVYDVAYTIDHEGRRAIPLPRPEQPEATVVFFGGSNTFGEGVNDDETLPFFLARQAPGVAVYNYGFCGYGPQQMLAQLEDGRLDALLEGEDAVGIYVFIDAHVQRAVGSMVVVTGWGADMPYYMLDRSGRLEMRGSFRNGRFAGTNWLYALASRSSTLRHFNVDLPLLSERHYELMARIIEASARRMAALARSSRFFVVLHPTVKNGRQLVQALDPAVVQVLDYSGAWPGDDPEFAIEGDWHPTPLAHRTLGEMLARDVLQ